MPVGLKDASKHLQLPYTTSIVLSTNPLRVWGDFASGPDTMLTFQKYSNTTPSLFVPSSAGTWVWATKVLQSLYHRLLIPRAPCRVFLNRWGDVPASALASAEIGQHSPFSCKIGLNCTKTTPKRCQPIFNGCRTF